MSLFMIILMISMTRSAAAQKMNSSWPLQASFLPALKNSSKPRLTIPSFVSYGGYQLPFGPIATVEIQTAIDASQKAGILSDYELSVRAHDDLCDFGYGITSVTKLLNSAEDITNNDASYKNMVPILVGPLCAYHQYVANFLKQYNFVMVAESAPDARLFHNRYSYDSFFSFNPSMESMYQTAVPAFLARNGWNRVFLLSETQPLWYQLEDEMIAGMAALNVTLAGVAKVIQTGTIPAPEQFEVAMDELASHDPRVVVIDSIFAPLMACWLYRKGLYGPKYVFVVMSVAIFLPDSYPRSENCSDKMLFEVLKSVIVFTPGFRIDLQPDAVDDVGVSGRYLLDKLKSNIDHPEMSPNWFFWKGQNYDQLIGGLLALDAVDKELKRSNDSLLNWVVGKENFRKNGSHFYSLMKQTLERLHFNGVLNAKNVGTNALSGLTAFYQIQTTAPRDGDFTSAVQFVPVALYDSSYPSPGFRNISSLRNFKWHTHNGQPPYDSLRIFRLNENTLPETVRNALIVLSALLIIANIILLAVNLRKSEIEIVPKASSFLSKANRLIQIGNVFTLCFVLIMTGNGSTSADGQCIAASLVLIFGYCLTACAIHGKMEIAAAITETPRFNIRSTITAIGHNRTKRVKPTTTLRVQVLQAATLQTVKTLDTQHHEIVIPKRAGITSEQIKHATKFWLLYAVIWPSVQLGLAVIWFGIEPLVVIDFDRKLEEDTTEVSVAYEHVISTCRIAPDSKLATGVIGTLIAGYGLIALRSIFLAITLRNCHVDSTIADLPMIRAISYVITLIVLAGGVVLWLFFNKDPGTLQIGVSFLALLVVAVVTALISTPIAKNSHVDGP